MKAKEMFKELGYKQKINDWYIEYIDNKQNKITFWFSTEEVISSDKYGENRGITLNTLKAICTQCKELGWLDE